MWSYDQCKQDLRVVLTLIIRMNLSKKRFFKHKNVPRKSGEVVEVKLKKTQSPKVQMNQLFELLIKFSKKHKKYYCIERLVEKIFNGKTEKLGTEKGKQKKSSQEDIDGTVRRV